MIPQRSVRTLVRAILTDSHFWLPAIVAILGIGLLMIVGRV